MAGEQTYAAIDFEVNQDPGNVDRYEMVVRESDAEHTKTTVGRGPRPFIGNPRSGTEKALYALGIVLLFGGLVLSETVGQTVGLGPQLLGLVIVVILFFRKLRYRGD